MFSKLYLTSKTFFSSLLCTTGPIFFWKNKQKKRSQTTSLYLGLKTHDKYIIIRLIVETKRPPYPFTKFLETGKGTIEDQTIAKMVTWTRSGIDWYKIWNLYKGFGTIISSWPSYRKLLETLISSEKKNTQSHNRLLKKLFV